MASGKGKAELTAVASDDDDAATAPISGREAQSRAGVLRQLRPDAQEHQVAASKAAVAKRSAGAMSKEERQAKRARHMKEVRERQRAARAATAAAEPAVEPAAVDRATLHSPPACAPAPVLCMSFLLQQVNFWVTNEKLCGNQSGGSPPFQIR